MVSQFILPVPFHILLTPSMLSNWLFCLPFPFPWSLSARPGLFRFGVFMLLSQMDVLFWSCITRSSIIGFWSTTPLLKSLVYTTIWFDPALDSASKERKNWSLMVMRQLCPLLGSDRNLWLIAKQMRTTIGSGIIFLPETEVFRRWERPHGQNSLSKKRVRSFWWNLAFSSHFKRLLCGWAQSTDFVSLSRYGTGPVITAILRYCSRWWRMGTRRRNQGDSKRDEARRPEKPLKHIICSHG